MNTLKRFLAICLCLSLLLPVAGCGSKESGGENTGAGLGADGDFVYTAEFKQLDGNALGMTAVQGSRLYYVQWNYDEATETSSSSVKYMDLDTLDSEEIPLSLEDQENVSSLQVLADGSLLLLLSRWGEGDPSFWLVKADASGKETMRQDVTELLAEGSGQDRFLNYPQAMQVDSDGNIYILVSGMNEKVVVLDSQGSRLFEAASPSWSQGMCQSSDGRVFLLSHDENAGQSSYMLQYVDPQTKSLGESLGGIPGGNGSVSCVPAGEKELLISSGNSLYRYDLEAKTCEMVLNWLNCDVNPDQIQAFVPLADGRILALTYDYAQEAHPLEAVYLTKTPASEVKQKTVLTYATMYLSYDMRSRLIRFNKTNDTWRIEVKEYGNGNYEDGLTQLNNDIVAGNPPDLIDLRDVNVENYIAKGVLTDLYPLMEADTALAKEDFLESALRIYEKNGRLYGICPLFGLSTLSGRPADIGGRDGWTVADLQSLLASKPAGTELWNYASREEILTALLTKGLDAYVDWTDGSCTFDSSEFISLLEFAGQFPGQDTFTYEDADSMYKKIQEGKVLLQPLNMTSVADYLYQDAMFDGEMACIGYPTADGSVGTYVEGNQAIGITEKSANKEGAWAFLSTLLSEEYQDTVGSLDGLPLRRSSLEKLLAKAMEPKEEESAVIMSDDFTYEMKAATQEQVDAIRHLLETAKPGRNTDTEIMTIISEEAASFFAGQKTAAEVAGIIQSRVQIYISENQ